MESIEDPLDAPIGRIANSLMSILEHYVGDAGINVVLIVVEGDGSSMAIESGGFESPEGARLAMRLALDFANAHIPVDLDRHPEEN